MVIAQLNQRVQGKTLGTLGYVIWIISVDNITSGKIDEDTGHATFVVEFSAIILRPLPREVMDCKVLDVDEVRGGGGGSGARAPGGAAPSLTGSAPPPVRRALLRRASGRVCCAQGA